MTTIILVECDSRWWNTEQIFQPPTPKELQLFPQWYYDLNCWSFCCVRISLLGLSKRHWPTLGVISKKQRCLKWRLVFCCFLVQFKVIILYSVLNCLAVGSSIEPGLSAADLSEIPSRQPWHVGRPLRTAMLSLDHPFHLTLWSSTLKDNT